MSSNWEKTKNNSVPVILVIEIGVPAMEQWGKPITSLPVEMLGVRGGLNFYAILCYINL